MCNNWAENADEDEILSFVEDVLRYLEDDSDDEHETNEGIIGMKNMFKECVVKV